MAGSAIWDKLHPRPPLPGWSTDLRDFPSARVIYVHASWCKYCRRFEEKILTSPEARALLDPLPRLAIEPETGPEARALADRLGVTGYPTLLVVPPGGGKPERAHP